MLSDVVVLPEAVSAPAMNDERALALLLDLRRTGRLLIDDQGAGIKSLIEAMDQWPDQVRRSQTKRAIMALKAANRISSLPPARVTTRCTNAGCNELRGVAQAARPATCVCGPTTCAHDIPDQLPLSGYVGSTLQGRLRDTVISFKRRGATSEDVARRVVVPLLRFAESTTVFDRNIGRSLQSPADRPAGRFGVPDRFAETIAWILDLIRLEGRSPRRHLRVVTGLQNKAPHEQPLQALKRWEAELRQAYAPVGFEVVVHLETYSNQLAHDRFLITEQASVQVSRGFDFLFTEREMREMRLDPIREARPTQACIFSLMPDAPDALAGALELDRLHPPS